MPTMKMLTSVFLLFVTQRVLCGNPYDVTIETGVDTAAGTHAIIFMRLYGQGGMSSDLEKISSGSISPNSVTKLTVDFKTDVGDDIWKIHIGHDNSGRDPAWKVKKITVKRGGFASVFVVDGWLESNPPTSNTHVEVLKQQKGNCGSVSQSRVVNGVASTPNQWPWQVQIKNQLRQGPHHCGGTLIHPQYVLTASHCFHGFNDAKQYRFSFGRHDLTTLPDQEIRASRIIMHEKWNFRTFNYDIALVKLARPVMLNNKVKLACLPNQGKHVQAGKRCFISGWGKTVSNGKVPNILRHAELPVVSNSDCSKEMNNIMSMPPVVTNQMLCGGGNLKSACHGDSGGPYVCRNGDSNYAVEGVVSWGHPYCATFPYYTVFARVSQFVDWIESNMYSSYIQSADA